jgi:hypothetical protein
MKRIAEEEKRKARYVKNKMENDKEDIARHSKAWAK